MTAFTIFAGFVALWIASKMFGGVQVRSLAAAAPWAEYARVKKYRVAAPTLFVDGGSPVIEGSERNVTFFIDAETAHHYKRGSVRTRIRARAERAESIVLVVENGGAERDAIESSARLSDGFVLRSGNLEKAREMMRETVETALRPFASERNVRLAYEHGEIELSWSGVENDFAILDSAVAVVTELANARPAIPYR